jgi:hypothetical protein
MLLYIFISHLTSCSDNSWEEKQITIDAPTISDVTNNSEGYPEYTINDIVFCLKIGVEFDEYDNPFSILLEALSKDTEKHVVKLEKATILSNKKIQYNLLLKTKLPQELKLEYNKNALSGNVYSFKFNGRLNPRFDENEVITVKLLLSVDGARKEIAYKLIPFIKKCSMNGLFVNKL